MNSSKLKKLAITLSVITGINSIPAFAQTNLDQQPTLPGQEFALSDDFNSLLNEMTKSARYFITEDESNTINNKTYHYRFVETSAELNGVCTLPKVNFPNLPSGEKDIPAACTTKDKTIYFINSALTKSVMEKNPALFATLLVHQKLTNLFVDQANVIDYDKIEQVVKSVTVLHQKRSEQLSGNWNPLTQDEVNTLNKRLETALPFHALSQVGTKTDGMAYKTDQYGGLFFYFDKPQNINCHRPLGDILKGRLSVGSVYMCNEWGNLNLDSSKKSEVIAQQEVSDTIQNSPNTANNGTILYGMDSGSVAMNSYVLGFVGKNSQITNSYVVYVGENSKVENSYARFIGKNSNVQDSSFNVAVASSKVSRLDSVMSRTVRIAKFNLTGDRSKDGLDWTDHLLRSGNWYFINNHDGGRDEELYKIWTEYYFGLSFSKPITVLNVEMPSDISINGNVTLQDINVGYLMSPSKNGDFAPLNRDLNMKNVVLKNVSLKTTNSIDALVLENISMSFKGNSFIKTQSSLLGIMNLGATVSKIKGLEMNVLLNANSNYYDSTFNSLDFRPLKNIENSSSVFNPCSNGKSVFIDYPSGFIGFNDANELSPMCK